MSCLRERISLAMKRISITETVRARAVSFTSVMVSLAMGGECF